MASWFVYETCRDLAATRDFWAGQLGLPLVWDEPDSIAVEHRGLQLSFIHGEVDEPGAWAFQPGWCHGQVTPVPPVEHKRSTSVALDPDHFRKAVARLRSTGATCLWSEPQWVGYWSFVVRDPDGRTVELSDPDSPGPEG